jgi:hypothetical protein
MEPQNPVPPTPMPTEPQTPPTAALAKKKEHWLVEVVGGFTVASTMVSALALWFVFADQMFTSLS